MLEKGRAGEGSCWRRALSNPLLAPQVFTESTSTRAGMRIIRRTTTLQPILARNIPSLSDAFTRFTFRSELRAWPVRSG